MKIQVFESSENTGEYFIQYAKSKQEAWDAAIIEYPEVMEDFKPEDIKEGIMYKCLDCNSYWMPDDLCGDCGEARLTKRQTPVYYLSHFTF